MMSLQIGPCARVRVLFPESLPAQSTVRLLLAFANRSGREGLTITWGKGLLQDTQGKERTRAWAELRGHDLATGLFACLQMIRLPAKGDDVQDQGATMTAQIVLREDDRTEMTVENLLRNCKSYKIQVEFFFFHQDTACSLTGKLYDLFFVILTYAQTAQVFSAVPHRIEEFCSMGMSAACSPSLAPSETRTLSPCWSEPAPSLDPGAHHLIASTPDPSQLLPNSPQLTEQGCWLPPLDNTPFNVYHSDDPMPFDAGVITRQDMCMTGQDVCMTGQDLSTGQDVSTGRVVSNDAFGDLGLRCASQGDTKNLSSELFYKFLNLPALKSKNCIIETDIPPFLARTLVGHHGRHVREVQAMTNTTINVSREHDVNPNPSMRRLQIAGALGDVYSAYALCVCLTIKYHSAARPGDDQTKQVLVLPGAKRGLLGNSNFNLRQAVAVSLVVLAQQAAEQQPNEDEDEYQRLWQEASWHQSQQLRKRPEERDDEEKKDHEWFNATNKRKVTPIKEPTTPTIKDIYRRHFSDSQRL